MTNVQKPVRNSSIDIFRYLCAVFVVSIHTSPLADISNSLGYLTTEVIPRIAVPFFFVTAGYFYIEKLEHEKPVFMPSLKKTLGTYLMWSIPYYLVSFCQWGYRNPLPFSIECIYSFFINGSSYHFWFFPALAAAVCITTGLYKLRLSRALLPVSLLLYGLGVVCCAYDAIAIQVLLLGSLLTSTWFLVIRRYFLMGFPFFASGQLICLLRRKKALHHRIPMLTVIAAAAWAAEILLICIFDLGSSIVLTFGLYPFTILVALLLLQSPMPEKAALSGACRAAANLMYYAHPLFIQFLNAALPITLSQTPMFVAVTTLTTLCGLLIHRSGNPFLTKLVK